MEIKYKVNKEFSITINSNEITGISTQEHKEVINILLKNMDHNDISTDEQNELLNKKTAIIKELPCINFLKNVEDYMDYIIKKDILQMNNPEKKKKDSLKIVGLPTEYLEREISSLSKSEKFKISLAISLLSNPNIIIFDNMFTYLDLHQEKEIITLIQKLKEQYNKIIIIIDDNCNKLYKYTNRMIFIKNSQIILSSPTIEAYTRVDFLRKHGFSIPDIIEVTYKAKKNKKIKLSYHKDIRDLIKDIYKHV